MPCYFLMLYLCSWETAGTYKSREITNASHSLCGEPCMLNQTVYKRTQENNFTPLSFVSGNEQNLLAEYVSLSRKRLHSKHSLLSTGSWYVLYCPRTAVFKDSLNGMCAAPQVVDTVFNMRPIRLLDTSASFHVTLAWGTRSSCFLSAERSTNFHRHRHSALRSSKDMPWHLL